MYARFFCFKERGGSVSLCFNSSRQMNGTHVSVIADFSGRIPGDEVVRLFVEVMLRQFQGVVWDDYSAHCWTLDEIKAARPVKMLVVHQHDLPEVKETA